MSETTQFERSIPQATCVMVEVSCTQGDPAGYEKLYRECYALAYNRAYYLLHHAQDAEDAVQAGYIDVWKQWPHLEPRGLCGYLLRAVTCRALDILRSKHSKPAASIEAQQIDVCVSWDADTLIDLASATAKLSPKLQQVVDLRMEGATWQEIQATLGITHACLNKRFYWLRVRLRRAVA